MPFDYLDRDDEAHRLLADMTDKREDDESPEAEDTRRKEAHKKFLELYAPELVRIEAAIKSKSAALARSGLEWREVLAEFWFLVFTKWRDRGWEDPKHRGKFGGWLCVVSQHLLTDRLRSPHHFVSLDDPESHIQLKCDPGIDLDEIDENTKTEAEDCTEALRASMRRGREAFLTLIPQHRRWIRSYFAELRGVIDGPVREYAESRQAFDETQDPKYEVTMRRLKTQKSAAKKRFVKLWGISVEELIRLSKKVDGWDIWGELEAMTLEPDPIQKLARNSTVRKGTARKRTTNDH